MNNLIINYRIKRFTKQYKLCRIKKKYQLVNPVKINNEYKIAINSEDIKDPMIKKIVYQIINFFPNEDYLEKLHFNLKDLEINHELSIEDMIKNIFSSILDYKYDVGYYNVLDNSISIVSKKEYKLLSLLNVKSESYDKMVLDTLSHELLHMTSSYLGDKTIYIGFYQATKKGLGDSLNEGYTEYLNRLYFNSTPIYYNFEVNIIKLLQEIIPSETLKKLYFESDLKGLFKILSLLSGQVETFKFMTNLDKMDTRIINSKKWTLKNLLKIYDYLIKVYTKKVSYINISKEDKEKLIEGYKKKVITVLDDKYISLYLSGTELEELSNNKVKEKSIK